jgi:hypothetical protein
MKTTRQSFQMIAHCLFTSIDSNEKSREIRLRVRISECGRFYTPARERTDKREISGISSFVGQTHAQNGRVGRYAMTWSRLGTMSARLDPDKGQCQYYVIQTKHINNLTRFILRLQVYCIVSDCSWCVWIDPHLYKVVLTGWTDSDFNNMYFTWSRLCWIMSFCCHRWSTLLDYESLMPQVINFVGLWVFDATGDQLCWTMSLWCHSWSTLLDYGSLMPQVINFVGLWVFDATGDQLCWTMSLWCHSWSTLLDYGSLIPLLTIYHFILKVSFIGREWTRVPQNHWPSEVTDKLNHIMLYTLPSVVLKI